MSMEHSRRFDDTEVAPTTGSGGLLHNAINEASRLVAAEVQLAKQEITESLHAAVMALITGTVAIFGIIGGIVLLIVGQGFNIIIGVFEPGIQGARLLFVENFSKYYEGNGRPFRPLRSSRKYTIASAPSSTARSVAPLRSGAPARPSGS